MALTWVGLEEACQAVKEGSGVVGLRSEPCDFLHHTDTQMGSVGVQV